MTRFARRASAVVTGLALVGIALAMLPPISWVSELADPWRLHLALVLAVASLGLQRRRSTVLGWIVAVAVAWSPLATRAFGPDVTPGPHTLRLVTFNALHGNTEKARALTWLARADADVIVLEEVDLQWGAALQDLPGFPHRAVFDQDGHFGLALLSVWPIVSAETRPTGRLPTTTLVATIAAPEPLRLIVTHTMPPTSPGASAERSADLEDVARLVGHGRTRTILAGDLNAPPWAPALRELLDATDLVDSGRGFGVQPTWPSFAVGIGISIDHVLVSRDLSVLDRHVGPDLGSDHRPLRVELSW